MKRNVILLGLAIVIACFAPTGYRMALVAKERHTRALYQRQRDNSPPLVLDATTKNILDGADRVETFRLVEDADIERTPAEFAEEQAATSGPHVKRLGDYVILHAGPTQDKAFAARLSGALSLVHEEGAGSQCFSPGVGFRVWKGLAHVDLCVCFYCSGVDIKTADPKHKALPSIRVSLDRSRAALLALSRQAFPQDKALAAVKDTEDS